MSDIVDDFLTRLQRHLPDQARELAPKLEAELRLAWGGTERLYIRKRVAANQPQARTAALGQALAAGQPLHDAFASAGLSRRSGFRHLNKRG